MKLIVINYDELNQCPTTEDVLEDITEIYKDLSIEKKEELGTKLNNQLLALQCNAVGKSDEVVFVNTSTREQRYLIEKIVEREKPDLLISYNLAGFELGTLTDSLSYNLFDCRQFHIIKKRNLPNEKYLQKLKSINLFIFEEYSI